jgi:phytoene synthase
MWAKTPAGPHLPAGRRAAAFQCARQRPDDYKESPEFAALMSFQIERAREYYRRAWELLPAVDRKRQRPGLLMAAIYRATLEEIQLDGPAKVLNQRLSLTPVRKLWLAWRTWTLGYKADAR